MSTSDFMAPRNRRQKRDLSLGSRGISLLLPTSASRGNSSDRQAGKGVELPSLVSILASQHQDGQQGAKEVLAAARHKHLCPTPLAREQYSRELCSQVGF